MIGGGVMAEAILSRLLAQSFYQPQEVLVSEPQLQRRDFLQSRYGIQVTDANALTLQSVEVLVLAIKPQMLDLVVQDLTTHLAALPTAPCPLVLSILAGVPLRRLEIAFPNYPVVRAMPNTPATIGAGMTAIAPGQWTQSGHRTLARQIFLAVGEVVEVPEALMDAVTGLSGSGPAFVAVMIEALSDGGVAVGLPRAIAAQLALQTVLGTTQLLQESGMHPAQLKDQVTSPGGTTIAGVAQLEQAGFRSALMQAVRAAYERSQELGTL